MPFSQCPDCSTEPATSSGAVWRQLERLVSRIQHKRLQFSAELLPKNGPERSALTDPRRRASLQRWVHERAAQGVGWAVAALQMPDTFLSQPLAPLKLTNTPRIAGHNNNNGNYYVSGTTADDCGTCAMCRDKTKFGGPNRVKKPCLARRVSKGVGATGQREYGASQMFLSIYRYIYI